MSQLYSAFTLFLSLLVEAVPFLLFGVLLSSALLLVIDEKQIMSKTPRNPLLGALVGSCVGFLFPVCECGNVPVARRLLMQGSPPAVAIGFLFAAPTINPVVIWSTWVAFPDNPGIVIGRIGFSLGIAVTLGCVFGISQDLTPLLRPQVLRCIPKTARVTTPTWKNAEPAPSLLQSGTFLLGQPGNPVRMDTLLSQPTIVNPPGTMGKPTRARLRLFLENTVQELRELGGMLIIGSAIASSIQVFVPRDLILSIGQDPVSAIIAMMVLGTVVSICSTVDAFFALSFASVFTSGSLLAFLVFGPMIDIKSIGLLLTIFQPRIVVYLLGIAAQLTFICTLIYSYWA
jgi:uncharacterized membrane protein YraQ (UPF0718 family)